MAQKKEFSRKVYKVQDSNLIIAMGTLDGMKFTYEEYEKDQKGIVLKSVTLVNATSVSGTGPVVVAGNLVDGTLEVLRMDTLAPNLCYKVGDGDKSIGFFSSKELKSAEEKTSSGGNPYHKIKFAGGEGKSIILNSFGFRKLPDGEIYPMVIQPANGQLFDVREGEFDNGKGEMVAWKTFYGFSPMQFQ